MPHGTDDDANPTARRAFNRVESPVAPDARDPEPAQSASQLLANRPNRIGHGILAAGDPVLMEKLREAGIVLQICPTSNLLTKALPNEEAIRTTLRAFVEHGVAFTIATDGPEMMGTHLRDELELLERIGALTETELSEANARGHAASFI